MLIQAIAAGFLVAQFVYHRWIEKPDRTDVKPREFQCPRSDEGAPIPLIFGRVRVRAPVLAWGYVTAVNTSSATGYLLWIVGIGMDDGAGTSLIHALYDGDSKQTWTASVALPPGAASVSGYGNVETLYGGASQVLANPGDTTFPGASPAPTWAGRSMIASGVPINEIPGFRGYISIFLHAIGGGWLFEDGSLNSLSFEVSSYRDGGGYPAVGIYAQVGQDSNPVNVIWDILKGKLGKLGISTSLLDKPSFQAAGTTLFNETHGYSRAFEDSAEAEAKLRDILEEIDGVLDENPKTGTLRLKLIRADYNPNDVFQITRANCHRLENIASGGWDGLPNRVRVSYCDRSQNYAELSVAASNQANAVGQDGRVREVSLRYLGTTEVAQANRLAERELAARSRPIMKLRAILDRTGRDLMRGDPVRLTWDVPQIPPTVFRVADIDRGALGDDQVVVDLIQDYFYSYDGTAPIGGGFGGEISDYIGL